MTDLTPRQRAQRLRREREGLARSTPADSLDALRAAVEALPRQMQYADPFFSETYDYETVGLKQVLDAIDALRTGQRSPRNDEPEPLR